MCVVHTTHWISLLLYFIQTRAHTHILLCTQTEWERERDMYTFVFLLTSQCMINIFHILLLCSIWHFVLTILTFFSWFCFPLLLSFFFYDLHSFIKKTDLKTIWIELVRAVSFALFSILAEYFLISQHKLICHSHTQFVIHVRTRLQRLRPIHPTVRQSHQHVNALNIHNK